MQHVCLYHQKLFILPVCCADCSYQRLLLMTDDVGKIPTFQRIFVNVLYFTRL